MDLSSAFHQIDTAEHDFTLPMVRHWRSKGTRVPNCLDDFPRWSTFRSHLPAPYGLHAGTRHQPGMDHKLAKLSRSSCTKHFNQCSWKTHLLFRTKVFLADAKIDKFNTNPLNCYLFALSRSGNDRSWPAPPSPLPLPWTRLWDAHACRLLQRGEMPQTSCAQSRIQGSPGLESLRRVAGRHQARASVLDNRYSSDQRSTLPSLRSSAGH